MTEALGDEEDAFATNVLQSYWDIFWNPEIRRRGGADVVGQIWCALAVMAPGEPVQILFNDEVAVAARRHPDAPVRPGDPVTADNVQFLEALEPCGIDPNAGWVVYAVLPDGHEYASFDFRRNRERSLELLALAREYLEAATTALDAGAVRPALENAMAGAELAITAQTYSMETEVSPSGGRRSSHGNRLHWTRTNVEHGNTTPEAHIALVELNETRSWSRYGEGRHAVTPDRARELVRAVSELIEDAARRVGPRLRTPVPEIQAPAAASAQTS